ncbi:hypothetical protein L1D46_05500 [Pseudoalteromonas sp. Isolate3]|uniref:hypothetical protein n=1 Tax=Pseudoalteromonas sp. Isolate3 TaxID=2908526 RepID=UPI001EFCD318|nr:hypothetical protein [Pseudoalteromonas sp. Isolate3]MCG9708254.1 hypothetical protein [Pseudoalteromonas sp. Isolate3]
MKKRPSCKQYLTHLFQQMMMVLPTEPQQPALYLSIYQNDVMDTPKMRFYYNTVNGRTFYDLEFPDNDEDFAERLKMAAGHMKSDCYLAANPIEEKKTA